ncbi:MAG: hypothetical protein AAGN46_10945 [Acidobacteriota bacterium]
MSAPRPTQLVFLGASNLAADPQQAVAAGLAAAQVAADDAEIWMAAGHGRAATVDSRFLLRQRTSLLDCDLWSPLRDRGGAEFALVADLGNDLAYGVAPERMLRGIDELLGRLEGARVSVVAPPVAALERRSRTWLRVVRRAFFPRSPVGFDQLLDRLRVVRDDLGPLVARHHRTTLVHPDPAWYGLDPIHLRRRTRAAAWRAILAPWAPRSSENDV